MVGIVLQLQEDSINPKVKVTSLLRKALMVSRKLDQDEIRYWISLELNGYGEVIFEDIKNIANYRVIRGQIKCHNPYHGWQSVIFANAKMSEMLSIKAIMQPIGQLEDILEKAEDELTIAFGEGVKNNLMKSMNYPLEPMLFIPRQAVIGIVEAVRNKILEWTLQLENKGILGENMQFSSNEKKSANTITHTTINNIGSMNNSQLQQNSSGGQYTVNESGIAEIKKIVDELFSVMAQLDLSTAIKTELQAELETIKIQIASPKPKQSVIRECLYSAKTILEGATGNLLATGIASQIPAAIAALGVGWAP